MTSQMQAERDSAVEELRLDRLAWEEMEDAYKARVEYVETERDRAVTGWRKEREELEATTERSLAAIGQLQEALDDETALLREAQAERDRAVEAFEAQTSGHLKALAERDRAVKERDELRAVVQTFFDRDDEWLALSNARPFDAEATARASIAKREAAKNLRAALSGEVE